MESGTLSLLICLKALQLFIYGFHEFSQLDLILVALVNQHFFERGDLLMTFIAQIVKLFKQAIDFALCLSINFLYLDIAVRSVLLFLNESIRA